LENALQYLPINVGLGVTFILDDTRRPLSLAAGLHDQRGLGNAVAYPCLHCGRQFTRVVGYRLYLFQEIRDPLDLCPGLRTQPPTMGPKGAQSAIGICPASRERYDFTTHGIPNRIMKIKV
jgi:hypothetical protein